MSRNRVLGAYRVLVTTVVALSGIVLPGLLGALEEDGGAKEALRDLKRAVAARDADGAQKAAVRVAGAGGASSLKTLLDLLGKIPPTDDGLYWSLIGGVASFQDRPALEALGKFIKENGSKSVSRDLVYGLGDNPSPTAVVALRPVAVDGPVDLRILAVTKLSRIIGPEAVDALIAVLKAEEKSHPDKPTALANMAADGLRAMTGQEFGTLSVNWEGWWQKNRDKPLRQGGRENPVSRTGTVVDFVKEDHVRKSAFFGVEKAPPESVVVLTAVFNKKVKRDLNNDRMEHIVENMKVPHVVVNREDFEGYDLSKAGVVLVNCAQFHEFCICPTCKPGGNKNDRLYRCTGCNKHELFSAKLKDPEVKKLTDFVMAGGFLFCEDWIVKEVLERAFPEFVAAGPKLKDDMVDVIPARGMGTHPYLRGIYSPKPVYAAILASGASDAADASDDGQEAGTDDETGEKEAPKGPAKGSEGGSGKTVVVDAPRVEIGPEGVKVKHHWKIDDESFVFKVLDRKRVVPLLSSGALQKQTEGNGVVALAFRPGSGPKSALAPGQTGATRGTPGVVVLVLSHFGKQDSREDEYTIQNLLLNVLLDANSARMARIEKTKK